MGIFACDNWIIRERSTFPDVFIDCDRIGPAVQTGEQYAFIYKAVNYYASQLSNAALDSL